MKKILKKISGRPNVFIISSERQFSLSNKLYYRKQMLQADDDVVFYPQTRGP